MNEKSEYQMAWDERVQDIEVAISERLRIGVTPDTLIANSLTVEQLCEYLDVKPDYKHHEGVAIAFGDEGEIPLRIYRSIDIPYGVIIIR